ncbi:pitrilysin family protein [soil metagenome]
MPTKNKSKLDRTAMPPLARVERLNVLKPEKLSLPNGIPVYVFTGLPQEAVKVEWVFNAGKWYEHSRLQASMTARMMKEGCKDYPSHEFHDLLDFYGATIKSSAAPDTSSFQLYSLNKHLGQVLPIVEDVIKEPLIEQRDMEIVVQANREQLKVNLMKPDYLADKLFSETLYGSKHPYGYDLEFVDYDILQRGVLLDYHKEFYTASNCSIVVSGHVDSKVLKIIEREFGGADWLGPKPRVHLHKELESRERISRYEAIGGSYQSALRIGKKLFNKATPDYQEFSVVNTILGGYFGSRLMSNIREDKGYTYGIYSGLSSMRHGGHFIVSAEVGVDVRQAAVDEIYKEMLRLQEEPVPKDELDLVRNYMMGRLQNSLDGPFKVAGLYKGLYTYDLDIDYIYSLVEVINTITPERIQELANKYLDPTTMHEITVG